jgi:hypothetical protein
MRKALLLAAGFVASTLTTSQAEAATWLIAAGGCVPDSDTLAQAKYQTVGGSNSPTPGVEFKWGVSGIIQFTCPVTAGEGVLQGPGYSLDLYAQSSVDQGDIFTRVFVRLLKMHLGTGAISEVAGCAWVDAFDDGAFHGRGAACTERFDPNAYLYYAKVTVIRAGAVGPNPVVRFHGLSIFTTP